MSQLESKKEDDKSASTSSKQSDSARICKYGSDGDTNGVIYSILKV